MRKLTLEGYLKRQLIEMSGENTTSLYKFSRLSVNNVRLEDVLCLYIALFVDDKLKVQLIKAFPNINNKCKLLTSLNETNICEYLDSKKLSSFHTIYKNYIYECNKKINEKNIQKVMREKISRIQKEKHISNYCIYKNLNLNPGNVNYFLHNNDDSKVSLSTARRILEFVTEY